MGRTRNSSPSVERAIKLTLDPVRDADVIEMLDGAPNKARLVIDALRGRRQIEAPAAIDEGDELREQLEGFLM